MDSNKGKNTNFDRIVFTVLLVVVILVLISILPLHIAAITSFACVIVYLLGWFWIKPEAKVWAYEIRIKVRKGVEPINKNSRFVGDNPQGSFADPFGQNGKFQHTLKPNKTLHIGPGFASMDQLWNWDCLVLDLETPQNSIDPTYWLHVQDGKLILNAWSESDRVRTTLLNPTLNVNDHSIVVPEGSYQLKVGGLHSNEPPRYSNPKPYWLLDVTVRKIALPKDQVEKETLKA